MSHPLKDWARRIEARRKRKVLEEALKDPHLAKDIGLPHRPSRHRRIDLW